MKLWSKPFYLLCCAVLIHGCIPVKQAPRISEYRIDRGVDIDKRLKTEKNIFIFQNRKKASHFFNFISRKYNPEPYEGGKRFSVNLNDTDFDIFVFAPQMGDTYVDFTGLADNDDNDAGIYSDNSHYYIAMRVSSEYEDDCLSLNSLYHNVVVDYLKKLKSEYTSSL